MSSSYRVLVGIDYRPTPKADEVRAEPGDIVTDLPRRAVKDLLAINAIEHADTEPEPELEADATEELD